MSGTILHFNDMTRQEEAERWERLCSAVRRADISALRKENLSKDDFDYPFLSSSGGNTLLHVALGTGKKAASTVAFLLSKGANPSRSNDWGFSAIHNAVDYGYVECLDVLLKHKHATVEVSSFNGKRPCDLIETRDKPKEVQDKIRHLIARHKYRLKDPHYKNLYTRLADASQSRPKSNLAFKRRQKLKTGRIK